MPEARPPGCGAPCRRSAGSQSPPTHAASGSERRVGGQARRRQPSSCCHALEGALQAPAPTGGPPVPCSAGRQSPQHTSPSPRTGFGKGEPSDGRNEPEPRPSSLGGKPSAGLKLQPLRGPAAGAAQQPLRALTLGVPVAQGGGAHVAQADGALAAAVHEHVALVWVQLRRRDHLRQLLHVGRLEVHDVWGRG